MTAQLSIKKNTFLLLILAFPFIGITCSHHAKEVIVNQVKVKAPFEMPDIPVPDFTNCEEFIITDFGAEQNNKEKTSSAIKKAIEAANNAGGGSVIIPEGEWLTGKVHLKSHVNLHLKKGAVLLFDDNPDDYLPAVHTTWEGLECYNYSPLIYAYECKNVAITGEGELKAKMDFWRGWFSRPSGHMNSLKRLYNMAAKNVPVEERVMVNDSANMRPHFIQFNRSKNILLDGFSITNSPFWTIHPYLCKNVVIRNLNVFAHGHNNDGVDPEMSQNMFIENCNFDQGDDAIAVKSGRNQDAWRLNTPTKNLVVQNCNVKNGHQLLAIGSELSGGVENVLMDNCTVADGANMFHLLFIKTNERRGGYVKNIYMQNIKADKMREGILGIETDVLYQWRDLVPTYEIRLTPISDIYMKNIKTSSVKFISCIKGQEEQPVENIELENVKTDTVREEKTHIHQNLNGFSIENNQ
ncbi:glycoside hydrolase family 28 protein [Marinilabilia salmonicolor]|uniref:Glycosyl hydrolase family 28 n=1 Tax=Marinilabilia salmonicolor TaxID=989 RepID=A0A368UIY9_9BACT|nr:glycoside hydrolase family 28 protein [Marinilabilia salmonicolor]RCW21888.1 glycosyl hydrolase family 28 [Marinilabilia salmonicolor]